MLGLSADDVARADLHELAQIHHGDAVRHVQDDVEIVGDEEIHQAEAPSQVQRIGNTKDLRRRSRPSWPRPHDVICQTRTRNAAGADATAAGDLSAGSDTDALAHFVLTVNYGLTVQATTGATRRDLERVADSILRDWPPTN